MWPTHGVDRAMCQRLNVRRSTKTNTRASCGRHSDTSGRAIITTKVIVNKSSVAGIVCQSQAARASLSWKPSMVAALTGVNSVTSSSIDAPKLSICLRTVCCGNLTRQIRLVESWCIPNSGAAPNRYDEIQAVMLCNHNGWLVNMRRALIGRERRQRTPLSAIKKGACRTLTPLWSQPPDRCGCVN